MTFRPTAPPKITEDPHSRPLPPSPLLGLLILLLPVAAIGLTVRQRALAASSAAAAPIPLLPAAAPVARYRARHVVPAPFPGALLALDGRGAADLARLFALSALEEPGGGLVVLPRADAMTLFGLAEDELLDQPLEELFLPGTLDAALAYLETELRIRADTARCAAGPRLLLVADCGAEADRIARLFARHPKGLSAVVLGRWPGGRAAVGEDGRLSAPPETAALLPERIPAMSRQEARHRLGALAAESQRRAPRSRRRHR